ncbi:hypothetical protein THRCLA_11613 [Thraustotheca clavata]|uniref:F-box/LRR-repeat protein 15-like leucin rich repeat domain-containing protein n=1 Tax=Thraustotheca clavata TaxID=74557 RepID=A0A1V9Y792_9STRA|nr:hypothetical protein THRCLA_11613 [Thraustotheca clavata]
MYAIRSYCALNLSGCRRLKDNGIIEMCKKFTKLTTLNLAYCDKLTDRGIWAATHNCLGLAELNLQELYLLTDKVFTFDHEGDGRANVAKTMLSQLKSLVLADCKGLSDTGIAYLHHRARQLESFDASGCINATTQMLKYMAMDIYNSTIIGEYIRVLDLSFCMNLTGAGLDYIKDRCKQLVAIFVTGCVYLNDENIVGLVKSCTKLTRIGLGYCRDITDAVLFAIADSLYLETLSLTRCSKITDCGVTALATQCNGITALSIGSCKRITNTSIQDLWENCIKLLELDVTYCPLITWDALDKFATKRLGMNLRRKIISTKLKTTIVASSCIYNTTYTSNR